MLYTSNLSPSFFPPLLSCHFWKCSYCKLCQSWRFAVFPRIRLCSLRHTHTVTLSKWRFQQLRWRHSHHNHIISSTMSLNASLKFLFTESSPSKVFVIAWEIWALEKGGEPAFHRFCSATLVWAKVGPCFSVSVLHSRCAAAPEWLPCTVNRHLRARQSVG